MPSRLRKIMPALLLPALLALAAVALHRLLAEVRMNHVLALVGATSPARIALALALTALSYLVLTAYDVLALRMIGRPLPYRTAALASFTSYTLSHNLGLALLTGGTARHRIYQRAGLSTGDVARVIALASLAFWGGVVLVAATALLVHREPLLLGGWELSHRVEQGVGVGALVLCGVTVAFAARVPIRLFGWTLQFPPLRLAIPQLAFAVLDLAAASLALFVLLPHVSAALFPTFFLAYALAIIAGLLSHIPGGIGVFETVIVAALPQVPLPALLAALALYRVVYYLIPLAVALVLWGMIETRVLWARLTPWVAGVRQVVLALAPTLLTGLTIVGGLVLLISGATPALPDRLHLMRSIVPLPFVEASQVAASLAGTFLLLLAPGLYRRLDGAFVLTRALLVAGIVFSLAKGWDYEEAVVLTLVAALLQAARRRFYRHTALTVQLLSPATLALVALAVATSIWIGFVAYREVGYDNELWWHFTWSGNASRFLRAGFGSAVLLVAIAVVRLLSAPKHPSDRSSTTMAPPADFEPRGRTDSLLALTGDKRFLIGDDGAFMMYQVRGSSWVVMGDPIGPAEGWGDLLWSLRERADAAQGRILLYQISADVVPLAIDLGLALIKYGEEARIPLPGFNLDGPARKGLRHALRRMTKEGGAFEIVPAAQVPALLPQLRRVSDAWLDGKREKGFSVGRFDETYLSRFDCALIRINGRIVAFANIWATVDWEEISVDLMRQLPDCPAGTMDFLFTHLMLHGQAQGYRWFNLGMAPLAGLPDRRLAPVWARVGGFIYRHGDQFYGFEGLRDYKQKFLPVWEPRYIAGTAGLALARSLFDLQALIAEGVPSLRRPRLKRAQTALSPLAA